MFGLYWINTLSWISTERQVALVGHIILITSQNGGLNQILNRQTSRSYYGSKVPAVTITVFKYRHRIGKIVVKTVLYPVT
jgi:hypothetical protein